MPKTKGVYKRGNIWWIRYAGPDGYMRFESTGGASHREAQVILMQRKQEVLEGKDPKRARKIKGNMLFRDLAVEYQEWASFQKSIKNKIYLIKNLVGSFGNVPIGQFTTMLVEQYQTKRLRSGRKPATANRDIATLSHMFTKAVDWEMVNETTLKNIRKVKLLPEENQRLRYLETEEYMTLIDCCAAHLKPIVITALNTGMRKSEILKLKWNNVDLKNGFILLDKTKSGKRREIPINDTLRKTLGGIIRRIDVRYVFYDPKTGKHYKNVQKSFESACRRAGINDFRFHDLRHTFASQLAMSGVDMLCLKEILGHASMKMTLRYAHLAPGHKVQAVKLLDERQKKKPTIQKLYTK